MTQLYDFGMMATLKKRLAHERVFFYCAIGVGVVAFFLLAFLIDSGHALLSGVLSGAALFVFSAIALIDYFAYLSVDSSLLSFLSELDGARPEAKEGTLESVGEPITRKHGRKVRVLRFSGDSPFEIYLDAALKPLPLAEGARYRVECRGGYLTAYEEEP